MRTTPILIVLLLAFSLLFSHSLPSELAQGEEHEDTGTPELNDFCFGVGDGKVSYTSFEDGKYYVNDGENRWETPTAPRRIVVYEGRTYYLCSVKEPKSFNGHTMMWFFDRVFCNGKRVSPDGIPLYDFALHRGKVVYFGPTAIQYGDLKVSRKNCEILDVKCKPDEYLVWAVRPKESREIIFYRDCEEAFRIEASNRGPVRIAAVDNSNIYYSLNSKSGQSPYRNKERLGEGKRYCRYFLVCGKVAVLTSYPRQHKFEVYFDGRWYTGIGLPLDLAEISGKAYLLCLRDESTILFELGGSIEEYITIELPVSGWRIIDLQNNNIGIIGRRSSSRTRVPNDGENEIILVEYAPDTGKCKIVQPEVWFRSEDRLSDVGKADQKAWVTGYNGPKDNRRTFLALLESQTLTNLRYWDAVRCQERELMARVWDKGAVKPEVIGSRLVYVAARDGNYFLVNGPEEVCIYNPEGKEEDNEVAD